MTDGRAGAERLAEQTVVLRERAAALRVECEVVGQRAEHYRDLYENSPDMYAVFAAGTGHLVECNETLARFLGYPRHELLRRSIFSLFAEQDADQIFAAFVRFVRDGEVEDERLRIRSRDGRRMPVSLSIAGTRDDSGQLVEGRVVMRDVAEIAGPEETLARSEERFRTLAETMGLVPWELALGPRVQPVAGESRHDHEQRRALATRPSWIGPQIEALLGYAPELFVKPGFWFERIHPEDRDRLITEFKRLIAAGESYEIEYRITAADGRVVSILDAVSIVRSPDGGISLIGVMVDVTEREQAAAEQVRLMRELDHRVKDALSTVLAVAERTRMTCASVEGFRVSFGRRLRTLARIHDTLAARHWERVSVGELVDAVLDRGAGAGSVSVQGSEVWLPLAAARVLGLALGELATSAALAATPAALSWERLEEEEEGGASVHLEWSQPDSSAWREVADCGLDRYLIEDGLVYELDARVTLRLDDTGVTCIMDIPLASQPPAAAS